GRLPNPGRGVLAGRGKVAAVETERDIPDRFQMANTWGPYSPCRHVHEPEDVPVVTAALEPPEDRTSGAQVELGSAVVVLALQEPCKYGTVERRPAMGTGEPPESPGVPAR